MDEPHRSVTLALPRRLGLADRELVSIVGAGGKSTIMFTLGRDLAASGARVILTTTTRVGANQPGEPICWSVDPKDVEAALGEGCSVFVAAGRAPGKIVGPPPAAVDRLFGGTSADFIVVEADGAAGRAIKAPADHEPVVPSRSTTVVVVASIHAVGRPIAAVAHRPELVAGLIGVDPDDRLTLEGVAAVLLAPRGGLKGIPEQARVVMVVTSVGPATAGPAAALMELLAAHPRVERAVTLA